MENRRRRRLAGILAVLAIAGSARTALAQCTGSVQLVFDGSPQAQVGVAYSGRFTLPGASGAVSFTLSAGQFPPGLQLLVAPAVPPNATLSGTPTQAGVFVFMVIGRETTSGSTCAREFTITVGASGRIAVEPSILSDGAVGLPYDGTLTASGGTAPYTFTLVGALPPGLELRADGRISGSPILAGAFAFGLEVSDAAPPPASLRTRIDYSLLVTATPQPRLEITLHDGGVAWGRSDGVIPYEIVYSNRGSATATSPVITVILDGVLSDDCDEFSLYAGTALGQRYEFQGYPDLPSGATGRISLPSTVCFRRVQEIVGTDGLAIETYQVVSQASIASRETSSDVSVAVTPYCESITCTTFCPLRYLSGYPCVEIEISPRSANLEATIGSPFRQAFLASRGTPPYVYSASDLPSGLSMAPDGTVSGTPSEVGRFDFTVGVRDGSSWSCHAEETYRVDVCNADRAPIFSTESGPGRLPGADAGRDYHLTIDVLCGTPPYRFDSPTGLPEGLTLSAEGSSYAVLAGRPVNAGFSRFTIRITDAAGRTHDANFDLVVGHCFLEFSPQELPPATVGESYDTPLRISGGASPYELLDVVPHCGFDGCGLNTDSDISKLRGIYNLHVDSRGVSGTPSEAGRPTFTVYFQDSGDPTCYASRTYTLEIRSAAAVCPPIEVAPADLPPAQVGVAYAAALSAAGGDLSVPVRKRSAAGGLRSRPGSVGNGRRNAGARRRSRLRRFRAGRECLRGSPNLLHLRGAESGLRPDLRRSADAARGHGGRAVYGDVHLHRSDHRERRSPAIPLLPRHDAVGSRPVARRHHRRADGNPGERGDLLLHRHGDGFKFGGSLLRQPALLDRHRARPVLAGETREPARIARALRPRATPRRGNADPGRDCFRGHRDSRPPAVLPRAGPGPRAHSRRP